MTAWTEDRIARLKTFWAERRTADWIARALGPDISRSAVLGKVHRLGLSVGRSRGVAKAPRPTSASPKHPVSRTAIASAPAPASPSRTPMRPALEAPPDGAVSILTVRRLQCRWPYGDPGTTAFCLCGRRVSRGAFCDAHAARAYRGPTPSPDSLMRLAGL